MAGTKDAAAKSEPVYQVVGWDDHFEGAKSKTYSNKSTCQMPTKHGLGYNRLVKRAEGAALFGAWCSMIQVLSRHQKPRQGYCTDTGRADGIPYSPSDLELITGIPAKTFMLMFQTALRQDVAWLRIPCGYHRDTTGPLHSDLDLDLDLDSLCSDSDKPTPKPKHIDALSWNVDEKFTGITELDRKDWKTAYPACDIDAQLARANQWLIANPTKAHKKRWRRFITGWLSRSQEKGGDMRSNTPNPPKKTKHYAN